MLRIRKKNPKMKYQNALLILTSLALLASCSGNQPSSTSSAASSSSVSSASQATTEESQKQDITEEKTSSEIKISSEEKAESKEESIDSIEEISSESEESDYVLDVKIASPTGAPAAALYKFIGQSLDDNNPMVDINAVASNVIAHLIPNSSKDIVIAPTNAGVNAIMKKNAPFKIAATITFGNFYLAATGNDENKTLDPDDYVVAFQQNNVPDKIFRYVYENLTNVHYVPEASDAAKVLISGKNETDDNHSVDYVLVAEPAMTPALSKNESAYQYASMSEEYAKKSDGKSIMQASVFVNANSDADKIDAFLDELEKDINAFLANPSVIDEQVLTLGEDVMKSKIGVPSTAVLKAVTQKGNRMGLGYKDAFQNKDDIATFLTLFNIEVNEEIYYK